MLSTSSYIKILWERWIQETLKLLAIELHSTLIQRLHLCQFHRKHIHKFKKDYIVLVKSSIPSKYDNKEPELSGKKRDLGGLLQRAGNSSALKATISFRVFTQVLLMIRFSIKEFRQKFNFCRYRFWITEGFLISVSRFNSSFELIFRGSEDYWSILSSNIVALTIKRSRIVGLPKSLRKLKKN